MNEKELEFSLKSLEADAAMEAVERRERGEPPSPESPLSDKDVSAIKALAVDLDEQFYERKAAQLIGALQQPDGRELGSLDEARAARAARNAGVARDAGTARATRTRRLKQAIGGAGALLAAAGFMLWLMPMDELGPVLEQAEVSNGETRGAADPVTAVALPVGSCLNVRIPLHKTTARLSEDVSTQAYLVRGQQSVKWNLALQPDNEGVLRNTAGCQPLPAGVAVGDWDLVVLVGYPGRLWWHGKAALQSTLHEHSDRGEHSGIQYVRRSLRLASNPAEPAR